MALTAALLWALHPLCTEAVAYTVQRAESMMALCYLLTLYCFARAVEPNGRRGLWSGLCWASCLVGMGCKEVMVSAPLLVFLYDRTFVSGTFGEAWRRHRRLYGALASTWLVLAYEVAMTGNRGATAGFGAGVAWWQYAQTQLYAIVHYLRLAVWPHPLAFDYGIGLVTDPLRVLTSAIVVLVLLVATAVALRKHPAVGFFGAAFWAILAPSSSVIPVATQTIAEHRMYLPLIAIVIGATLAAERILRTLIASARSQLVVGGLAVAGLSGLFLVTTRTRNRDYRTDESIWRSAAQARPGNPRAHCNLGFVLSGQGETREAMAEYEAALRLDPTYSDAQSNLGAAYFQLGDQAAAIEHCRAALRLNPNLGAAHYNLGGALVRTGAVSEGLAEFQESLRIDNRSPDAHYNLATALLQLRRLPEAVAEYREAIRIRPDYAEACNNLANALLETGHADESFGYYLRALQADPRLATAHFNLGNILAQRGQLEEAMTHYRTALAIKPEYAKAHCNLGSALVSAGRLQEAVAQYREALRLDPRLTDAKDNLSRVENYLGGLR